MTIITPYFYQYSKKHILRPHSPKPIMVIGVNCFLRVFAPWIVCPNPSYITLALIKNDRVFATYKQKNKKTKVFFQNIFQG